MAFTGGTRPKLWRFARVDFDPVRQRRVLLYPEGSILLNDTAAEVLALCDGERTIDEIAATLGERYAADVRAAVLAGGAGAALAQQPRSAPSAASGTTAALPAAAAGMRATLEKVIHKTVLPNGLEVIVIENHGVPLATVEIDVKNGAFTQTPEYEGLAHMYEHMFFKANASYPEPEQFVQRAAELGAVFNGSTREEVVNYYITLPSDSVAAGLGFLASAFRAPLFRSDELESERQVVLGEYDRQE